MTAPSTKRLESEDQLSLTDWLVLAMIVEEDRHGFSVARELAPEAPLGQVWTVPRPLVYRSIERLTDLGLVRSTRVEQGGRGPLRTVVRASAEGRRWLSRWLERPVEHPRDVRTTLLAKFVLLERQGRSRRPLAERQLEQFASLAERIGERARESFGPERVSALYRFETMQAITRTLTTIASEDEEPTGP